MTDKQAMYQKLITESYHKITQLEAEIIRLKTAQSQPIAIIGLGCRYPGGAENPATLWHLLQRGGDAISEVPPNRWDVEAYYHPQPATPGKIYTRYGGFMPHLETFDAEFFGLSPREAIHLDPQQRLLLEVAWEALEDAALPPSQLPAQSGVFIGISSSDYLRRIREEGAEIDIYVGTGNAFSTASGRLSHRLNLQGPSLAIDTACSSSLAAIHLAVQSLRRGDCPVALAGGVNRISSPEISLSFAQGRALAADGRCKTFDASADGFVRSEGCGLVILKPLAAAERDGNRILGVIRGSATSHDGHTSGLTVPSGPAQQSVVRAALADANLGPQAIDYIEAHGTGTALGDPIEVNALAAIFAPERTRPLYLGSIKTNFGHTEAAAGVAGLIKVILAMQHNFIPPHLHFKHPSPHIPWATLPFVVPTQGQAWPKGERAEKMAGVSAFGFNGTNVHLIISQPPAPLLLETETDHQANPKATHQQGAVNRSSAWHILPLSAKSEAALKDLALRYTAAALANQPWPAITHTASTGRDHFRHRLAIVAPNLPQAQASLRAYAQGEPTSNLYRASLPRHHHPQLVFLFTGTGSQYINMGQQLYQTEPVFRAVLEECQEILGPRLDTPLLHLIYPPAGTAAAEQGDLLNRMDYLQPAFFAVGVALARLWQAWGVQPAVVSGHSLGEYVAACLAGAFTLAQGLTLVAERARLIQTLTPDGGMVIVFANQKVVAPYLAPYPDQMAIASIGSPQNTVIAGANAPLATIVAGLKADGLETRPLPIKTPFHSPLMAPAQAPLAEAAAQISYQPLQIPLLTNLNGALLPKGYTLTAEHWREHLCQPVYFARGLQTLGDQGYKHFLEIGPQPLFANLGQQTIQSTWLASLRKDQPDQKMMREAAAQLYTLGYPLNWAAVQPSSPPPSPLPTYPFQRQRYWIPERPGPQPNSETHQPQPDPRSHNRMTDTRLTQLQTDIQAIAAHAFRMPPHQLPPAVPLMELGGDSIVLTDMVRALEKTYGLKITMRQMFEELDTIQAIAAYIHQALPFPQGGQAPGGSSTPIQLTRPVESPAVRLPPSSPSPTAAPLEEKAIAQIMKQQLQTMHEMNELMAQQIALLSGNPLPGPPAATPAATPAAAAPTSVFSPLAEETERGTANIAASTTLHQTQPAAPAPTSHNPGAALFAMPRVDLSERNHCETDPRREAFMADFMARYTARTAQSKATVQAHRSLVATSRASAGFRHSIKEMLYPILGHRAAGARLWDVDGNEYVDLAMGFGVHLFGHNPPFIMQALKEQLDLGIQLGPHTALAGEVAALISELTGVERVAFCNTGSEAVMTAVRLARAATGRHKIVRFNGAYHGHFDGLMAVPRGGNADPQGMPMAPGITPNTVADVLMLDYDNPQSLEIIKANAHHLAAVLASPVQSRRPGLQPKAFLGALRHLTTEAGIPLIFDEVITGFRIHPGGAQAWFNVQADLVAYGKAIGGGLPIGVIAGKATYMDCLDGGYWQYGDDSYPARETTFFASTFSQNPATMVTALAALGYLKEHSPTLQETLNARSNYLAREMNARFQAEGVPMQLDNFGSLLRFEYQGNMDIFFYLMVYHGVYFWEGRTAYLSTAHTDEDIAFIIQTAQTCLTEMRQGGLLPDLVKAHPAGGGITDPGPTGQERPPAVGPQPYPLYPLSEAQRQLWVLAELDIAGSLAYHIPLTLQLSGPLNLAALREAVQQLIARHPALRTTITPNGQHQIVSPSLYLAVPLIDLTTTETTQTALEDWFMSQNEQPFDLTTGPLLRATILKTAPQTHLLALIAHHIISDGWSTSVILAELSNLYTALATGQRASLPPALPYQTYLTTQNAARQGEAMQAQRAYWLKTLAGPQPTLNLPIDHARPPIKGYRAARHNRQLSTPLTTALRTLARTRHTTLFMLLASAYSLLLHRLSGQDALIFAVPVAGRREVGDVPLIGYCTHVLAVKSQVNAQLTFSQHLATIKATLLAAYDHQDYPFAWLLNDLNVRRDTSTIPLTNTLFNLDKLTEHPTWANLEADLSNQPIAYAPFDLCFDLLDLGETIRLKCDYSTDLFEATTIDRWLTHFETLLTAIVAEPEANLTALPLLTRAERTLLLETWNKTEQFYKDGPLPMHTLFEAQAERSPDHIALRFGEHILTYRQLNAQANQLAHYLHGLGVGPDSVVGLALDRSIPQIVALLAILKAGGAYLPLDLSYPAERLAYMLAKATALWLISDSNLITRFSGSDGEAAPLNPPKGGNLSVFPPSKVRGTERGAANPILLDLIQDTLAAQPTTNPNIPVSAAHLLYVMYTSGSTGRPKGVALPHQAFYNLMQWQARPTVLPQASTTAQFAPISFDVSAQEIFTTLTAGGTLVLISEEERRDFALLLQRLNTDQVSRLFFPAGALQTLIKVARQIALIPQTLQQIITAGEPLHISPEVVAFCQALPGVELHNHYGPTETHAATGLRFTGDPTTWPPIPTIGSPISNTKIYILDQAMQPTPLGVPGDLYITGIQLARGYFNRPALTAERFIPNPFVEESGVRCQVSELREDDCLNSDSQIPKPEARLYKTGDLARYRPDGQIEFLGRRDHQVKIRGFRVELGEVEAHLRQHPQVRDVVVMAHRGEGVAQLVAYLQGGNVAPADLTHFLSQRLPDYMLPAAYVTLDAFPKTPSNKIDRRALPAPDFSQLEPGGDPPATETEKLVATIWAEVLNLPQPGREADFFKLGGHSLTATLVITRLREVFGQAIPLRAIFEQSTLQRLAAYLDTVRWAGSETNQATGEGGQQEDRPTNDTDEVFEL